VQVLGTAVLWGAGTALGEVPPYALSYHAAKAGKRSAEVEAMLGVGAAAANGSRGGGFTAAAAMLHVGRLQHLPQAFEHCPGIKPLPALVCCGQSSA
jgi:hypothetical protein